MNRLLLFVLTGFLGAIVVGGQVPRGIARLYPGDRDIERDTRVLWHEDFEANSLASVLSRWTDASNKDAEALALVDGGPAGTEGRRCLQMTATLGRNTGGHLYKRLDRGVDTLYTRFYVRFADKPEYVHHFVTIGGYNPPTNWPQGGAGERPRGDERVTVGIEPHGDGGRFPAPGAWAFYAYWPEMKISADGRFWGNAMRGRQPAVVPSGKWQCVEVMLKLNSQPDERDGELALWLDGQETYRLARGTPRGPWTGMGFQAVSGGVPFEGFRWRTSQDLKLNFLWLLHYVTDYAARANRVTKPNPVNRVWFDDIVVATEYVGPVHPLGASR